MGASSIMGKLMMIQNELEVPKNRYNSYGDYHFRNLEDILDAGKPILEKYKCVMSISDKVVEIGGSNYVEATATLHDTESGESHSVTAYARETMERKKFDSSQLTGSASSYARKYAANGLLAIDDVKDADNQYNDDGPSQDRAEDGGGSSAERADAPVEESTPPASDEESDLPRSKRPAKIDDENFLRIQNIHKLLKDAGHNPNEILAGATAFEGDNGKMVKWIKTLAVLKKKIADGKMKVGSLYYHAEAYSKAAQELGVDENGGPVIDVDDPSIPF
jgi:hypothetical protein